MSKLMKSVVDNIHKGVTKTIDHGISLVLMEEKKRLRKSENIVCLKNTYMHPGGYAGLAGYL